MTQRLKGREYRTGELKFHFQMPGPLREGELEEPGCDTNREGELELIKSVI
jgi:hypothetical protein